MQEAIAGAQAAQILWRQQTAENKAKVLRRWYELIEQHHASLAKLLTIEQGKPLAEAKGKFTTPRALWNGTLKKPNALMAS